MNSKCSRYLAGFLDGEGSFGIANTSITIRVTNTHKTILDRLAEVWGGTVRLHRDGSSRTRTTWQWVCCGQTAASVLVATIPHLREKRIQAKLLLEFRQTPSQDPLRAWLRSAISDLKHLEHRIPGLVNQS